MIHVKELRQSIRDLVDLLQPLEIPEWKWEHLAMDFVVGLPRTKANHDAIWVIIDRLTKSAHFLPINEKIFIGQASSSLPERDSSTTWSSSIDCI